MLFFVLLIAIAAATSPVTEAPVTTAPVTATPLTTAPVTKSPVTTPDAITLAPMTIENAEIQVKFQKCIFQSINSKYYSTESGCSVSCGGGLEIIRYNVLDDQQPNGAKCPYPLSQSRQCSTEECPQVSTSAPITADASKVDRALYTEWKETARVWQIIAGVAIAGIICLMGSIAFVIKPGAASAEEEDRRKRYVESSQK